MRFFHATYLYAVLFALTVAAYVLVWSNDFVDYDDPVYITSNPQVTNGFTWDGFRWAWTVDRSPYLIPLTWFSLQLDAHCFGERTAKGEGFIPPAAVHGQNLFWHAANVLLLFGFWQRITGRRWPSFFVAALFALHPMHVESVAWASERKDVLSVFFGLLTLGAYVRYVEKPGWFRYGILTLAYALSLFSKPMLLTLPCALLLLDYWPLRRVRGFYQPEAPATSFYQPGAPATGFYQPEAPATGFGEKRLSGLILEKMPLFVLAAVVGVLTLEARETQGSIVSFDTLPLSARFANALTAYGCYLRATFFPLRLAILYPHPYENWSLLSALAGAALLFFLTLFCGWQARRRPWLIVGWLWFVGTLLPVIGFAQGGKQAWADRFSYWPHIGLFVALVWGLSELIERFRVPLPAVRLIGAAVLGWLAFLTWGQVGVWQDTRTLWQQALDATHENEYAHEHLARYYHTQGRDTESEPHHVEAYRLQRQRRQLPPLERRLTDR